MWKEQREQFKRIDKQLRLAAVISMFKNPKTKKDYLKYSLSNQRLINKFIKGTNIPNFICEQQWVWGEDKGANIRVCVYRPKHGSNRHLPGVLWIHGGGYSFGSPELSKQAIKALLEKRDCVVIAPDYRLSVQEPYPAALLDCYTVLLWMKKESEYLGINVNQIMVGGESAGGGLAIALSLYARDKKDLNIAFIMPLYPMIDATMVHHSVKNDYLPVWNAKQNRWAWELYLGDLLPANAPVYASPSNEIGYQNLPPTFSFVGSLDPFLDETKEFIRQLKKAKVFVRFFVFKGAYHGFDMICPNAQISKRAKILLQDTFAYAVTHFFAENSK